MGRKFFLKAFWSIALCMHLYGQSFGLEIETHRRLNEYIATNPINNFSLDEYVVNQLGFKAGVGTPLKSDSGERVIWEWVRDGGEYEDRPGGLVPSYTRSFNHFHDPLIEPWTNAGLGVAGYSPFKSSLIWAQEQGAFGSLFGGDWSWKKARNSFYNGLTSLNKDDRDKNLADAFRALGQVMHLVQDASVPAHVRNDIHVYFKVPLLGIKTGKYHYEVWVDNHRRDLNLTPSQIFLTQINTMARIPILRLATELVWRNIPMPIFSVRIRFLKTIPIQHSMIQISSLLTGKTLKLSRLKMGNLTKGFT